MTTKRIWIIHNNSPVRITLHNREPVLFGQDIYTLRLDLGCITMLSDSGLRHASWLGEKTAWLNMPTTHLWRAEQKLRPVRIQVWREVWPRASA